MKKNPAILLVFTVILFLFACGKNGIETETAKNAADSKTQNEINSTALSGYSFTDENGSTVCVDVQEKCTYLCSEPTKAQNWSKPKFQAIRTGCYQGTRSEYPDFPYVVIIETSAELKKYINENENNFDLSRKNEVYADTTTGFLDAVDKYDDEYFKEKSLIIAIDSQPSGSIRYTNAYLECTENSELFDTLRLTEYHPCLQTCDEAAWHIIVEAKKGTYAKNIQLKVFEDHEEEPEYLNPLDKSTTK